MTLGDMLWSLRECDEVRQAEFARRLDVSRSHLWDVEKGRKAVSPERAGDAVGGPERLRSIQVRGGYAAGCESLSRLAK